MHSLAVAVHSEERDAIAVQAHLHSDASDKINENGRCAAVHAILTPQRGCPLSGGSDATPPVKALHEVAQSKRAANGGPSPAELAEFAENDPWEIPDYLRRH